MWVCGRGWPVTLRAKDKEFQCEHCWRWNNRSVSGEMLKRKLHLLQSSAANQNHLNRSQNIFHLVLVLSGISLCRFFRAWDALRKKGIFIFSIWKHPVNDKLHVWNIYWLDALENTDSQPITFVHFKFDILLFITSHHIYTYLWFLEVPPPHFSLLHGPSSLLSLPVNCIPCL